MATAQIITANPLITISVTRVNHAASETATIPLYEARSLRDALTDALRRLDDAVWVRTGSQRDSQRQPVPEVLPVWVQDLIEAARWWRNTVNLSAARGSRHGRHMNRLIQAVDAIPGVDASL